MWLGLHSFFPERENPGSAFSQANTVNKHVFETANYAQGDSGLQFTVAEGTLGPVAPEFLTSVAAAQHTRLYYGLFKFIRIRTN